MLRSPRLARLSWSLIICLVSRASAIALLTSAFIDFDLFLRKERVVVWTGGWDLLLADWSQWWRKLITHKLALCGSSLDLPCRQRRGCGSVFLWRVLCCGVLLLLRCSFSSRMQRRWNASIRSHLLCLLASPGYDITWVELIQIGTIFKCISQRCLDLLSIGYDLCYSIDLILER